MPGWPSGKKLRSTWCPVLHDRARERTGHTRRVRALRHSGRAAPDPAQWFFKITALRAAACWTIWTTSTGPSRPPAKSQKNWIGSVVRARTLHFPVVDARVGPMNRRTIDRGLIPLVRTRSLARPTSCCRPSTRSSRPLLKTDAQRAPVVRLPSTEAAKKDLVARQKADKDEDRCASTGGFCRNPATR